MNPYTRYYWLEDVDITGTTTLHGPRNAEWAQPHSIFVGLLPVHGPEAVRFYPTDWTAGFSERSSDRISEDKSGGRSEKKALGCDCKMGLIKTNRVLFSAFIPETEQIARFSIV